MGKLSNEKVYCKEVYGTRSEKSIKLAEGDYYERHYVVLRHKLGTPNAYIEVKPDDWLMTVEPSEYAKEHGFDDRYDAATMNENGGATYFGPAGWDKEDKRMYVGWDYGHCEDYDPSWPEDRQQEAHKWTFMEIMMDVAHAYDGIMLDNDDHWAEMHDTVKM